jgi:hypothetical protein
MVANSGTVPVRRDITLTGKYNLPAPEVAIGTGIKINYTEVMSRKEELVQKFSELFK